MSISHTNKRLAVIISTLLFVILTLTLYANATTYPLTVRDDLDRDVKFTRAPQRIISLASSHTEILYALGLEARVIALDDYSNYPAQTAQKPRVGNSQTPSLERIIAMQPDLILVGDVSDKALVDQLAKLGLPALGFAPHNLAEVYEAIEKIGLLCDVEQRATQIISSMKATQAAVVAAVKKSNTRPNVLFEVWCDPLYTAGPGSFIDELITMAGGKNIAADAKSAWPVLSLETAIAANPDVILTSLTIEQSVVNQAHKAAWANVSAVKFGRVYVVDQDIISRPGPRITDGLLMIARLLHPELF